MTSQYATSMTCSKFGQQDRTCGAYRPIAAATQWTKSLWQIHEVSIPSVVSGHPGVCYYSQWSRHGIRLDLKTRGLANTKISYSRWGASWIHKLPQIIHLEKFQGACSTDGITNDIKDISWQEFENLSQMGMDSGSRVGILKTWSDLHWGTDPPASRSGQADHCLTRCEWIGNCRHSQSVGSFQDSKASQFVLLEVFPSQTELWHLWSEVIGHCGKTYTVAAIHQGHQLQNLQLVRLHESRIFPDIESPPQKTSQVVGIPFSLQPSHRAPGRQ